MNSVLILCESLNVGGAERALYTLLKHIDKTKFKITLCVLCDSGYYSTAIKQISNINYVAVLIPKEKGIKKFIYKLKYNLIYKYLPPHIIYKLFIPKKRDLEIAFCEGFSTKIIAASTNKKSKKIAWVHTDLQNNNWPITLGVYKDIKEEIKTYTKYNNIVGVSNSVSENLKLFLQNKTNIYTLYNLIDEQEINQQAKMYINYKYNKNTINIVSVGRLEYVKGYDRLINVCSKLINKDKIDITLTIIGNGTQFDKLNFLIEELNTKSRIKLLGMKENPYPYINNADLYVCPSRQEGYNIALAEAIILGKPCISTKCSGPDEILDYGKYGLLVENNDNALYLGIKDVCVDVNKLKQIKNLSIARRTFFNINRNINITEKFLTQ